jgi:hypothetical protein
MRLSAARNVLIIARTFQQFIRVHYPTARICRSNLGAIFHHRVHFHTIARCAAQASRRAEKVVHGLPEAINVKKHIIAFQA